MVLSKAWIARTEAPNGVRIEGEIDLANADELEVVLREALGDGQITVDFRDLTFIDSSGLHAILRVATDPRNTAPIRLVGASRHVRNLLQVVGIADLPALDIDGGGVDG